MIRQTVVALPHPTKLYYGRGIGFQPIAFFELMTGWFFELTTGWFFELTTGWKPIPLLKPSLSTLFQLILWLVLFPSFGFGADALELYSAQIKPLFRARCFSCHGALKQEADLRLDSAESMIDAGVVTRGDVSGSSIVARVTATDRKSVV